MNIGSGKESTESNDGWFLVINANFNYISVTSQHYIIHIDIAIPLYDKKCFVVCISYYFCNGEMPFMLFIKK